MGGDYHPQQPAPDEETCIPASLTGQGCVLQQPEQSGGAQRIYEWLIQEAWKPQETQELLRSLHASQDSE